ncbi:related to Aminodeoxychorismate synthase [Zygosaccharomyces bailii]|nr:related to Aminodeoxychorismate synthase [Zygosaccharomyces bailii]
MAIGGAQLPLNVLFIDSYDSFSYNVVRLVEQQTFSDCGEVQVTIIHNDTFAHASELNSYLKYFDCVVIGPGPGNPVNGSADVGLLATLFDDKTASVPILGICLGFQAMCLSQGSQIAELDTIKHGQVCRVYLSGDSALFHGYPSFFKSTRYHSLHAYEAPNLIPLAYTKDENGQLLMAVQVKNRPWYGVQYHPESHCSELGGLLINNFLKLALEYNKLTGRDKAKREDYNPEVYEKLGRVIDKTPVYRKLVPSTEEIYIKEYNVAHTPNLTLKICDEINQPKLVMASSSGDEHRGQWSIICLPNGNSDVFTHYSSLKRTTIHKWRDSNLSWHHLQHLLKGTEQSAYVLQEDKDQFWNTVGDFMKHKLIGNYADLPFLGGLVGTLGYEMGDIVPNNPSDHPDAKLVYIENSILINHIKGKMYAVSLSQDFPPTILKILDSPKLLDNSPIKWPMNLPETCFDIITPNDHSYSSAFDACQEHMHRGDSYEMCLTRQTCIRPDVPIQPWRIFQTLVQRNPAPFSSFFEFSDLIDLRKDQTLCLLSTSPERFLQWNRDTCELRPIKGTVKKGPTMCRERAIEILKTPKEFGENLMILDLIRNDLYELLPRVQVQEFMAVEEYQTVYQLVSVVKGEGLANSPYSGLDVLKHSLPAGSMTGAPKKITVQLLHDIERSRRGIYSGVTGYWSVNDNADWSVNIRCLYSYDGGLQWYCGAGGAITVLSTREGELEELKTKLESALQVFT